MRIEYILFLALIVGNWSCSTNTVYEKEFVVAESEWNADQKAEFIVPINDTVSTCSINLEIKNTNSYKWSNLFVFSDIYFPSGTHLRDTVDLLLAYRNGKWTGEKNGDFYTTIFPYKPQVRFPEKGDYKIVLEQGMRAGKSQTIEGISSIRIIVNKIK